MTASHPLDTTDEIATALEALMAFADAYRRSDYYAQPAIQAAAARSLHDLHAATQRANALGLEIFGRCLPHDDRQQLFR